MKQPFQRAPVWFAIALVIMSAAALLVYNAIRQADEIEQWLLHTRDVINTVGDVGMTVATAERSARSYVLTGDVRHLEPFHKSIERASILAEQLEKNVKDNAAQSVRARQMRLSLRATAAILGKLVDTRSREGFAKARELLLSRPELAGSSQTELLLEMRAEEERLLADRSEQSAQARRLALWAGLLGVLLNAVITGMVIEILRRENRSRQEIQRELHETNQAMQEGLREADLTAGRLAKTIENFPLGVLLTDADLNVVAFNNHLIEMIGAPEGAIRPGDGLEKVWLFGLHDGDLSPDDKQRLAQRRRDLIDNPKSFRFERIHANGRLLEARGIPLPGGGFLKVYTDITKQRAEAQKLLEERNSAEEIARAKSEFLAVMSHEVRTPMNGVMGIAELLRDTELSAEQRNYVDIIVRSGESLLTILNDILDLSKVEAGKIELESIPFNPKQVLEDVVALWGPRAAEKELSMSLRLGSELPPMLMGDAGRLRQVIGNLVGNAVKFTERGGITIDARLIAMDKDGALLNLAVTDTGIGISEAQRSRLFQPFSQADASTTRKFGGTGLGLAISARLVEQMGGAIDVFSREWEGSVFSFTARFALCMDRGAEEDAAAAGHAEGSPTFQGRVMVVEDHLVNRQVARATLDRLGLEVIEAVNGREAVDMFVREKVDLIFMDMHMPVMDGMEATRIIREAEQRTGQGQHVPIVAMTANVLPEAVGMCTNAGMDGFLSKPFARQQLIDALEHWLPAAGGKAAPLRLEGPQAAFEKETLRPAPAWAGPADADTPVNAAQEPVFDVPFSPAGDHAKAAASPARGGTSAKLPAGGTASKPPAGSDSGAGPVLDMERYALLEETMGEEMSELLGGFHSTSEELMAAIIAACETGDWNNAFRNAHTLNSSAAMVGAVRLSALARRIEHAAMAGGSPDCAALAGRIRSEFAVAREALDALASRPGMPIS
jgi:signal transduction histidine kinase/CHASE3 domain sensor protein/HPt (histidine-containing phosphotransfer) domain-containing protein/ActR/RegA family two-component response regulator